MAKRKKVEPEEIVVSDTTEPQEPELDTVQLTEEVSVAEPEPLPISVPVLRDVMLKLVEEAPTLHQVINNPWRYSEWLNRVRGVLS